MAVDWGRRLVSCPLPTPQTWTFEWRATTAEARASWKGQIRSFQKRAKKQLNKLFSPDSDGPTDPTISGALEINRNQDINPFIRSLANFAATRSLGRGLKLDRSQQAYWKLWKKPTRRTSMVRDCSRHTVQHVWESCTVQGGHTNSLRGFANCVGFKPWYNVTLEKRSR